MALDDVVRLVKEKDESDKVHATLHDMYLRESAEKPSYDDFDEKFQLQLKERGLDNSVVEELAEIVGDELLRGDDGYEKKPEEFAKEFIKKTEWKPPEAPVVTSEEPTFVESDGFQKNETTGKLYLADKTTEVYLHTGYAGLAVYYDDDKLLYRHGESVTPFTDVDGFVRDLWDRMFLPDRTTEVFPHTGYPGLAVYYDRADLLYQHGVPYLPVAAEAAAETPVSLATDEAIVELLDSATNYDELTKAVAAGELFIEYDDEDIESFSAEQFVNID